MADDFDEGDKMRRWTVKLDDPTVALEAIGLLMVSESQRAFKKQRFGKDQWPQRAPINVYGIIADLSTANRKEPLARRFERRPALIDKGANGLLGSITHDVDGRSVTVGSKLEYAEVHHTGGKIESQPISGQVRSKLWEWLQGRGKKYKFDLGWLLNKKFKDETLKGTVPKRPFVGITRNTEADIKDQLGVKIMEVE